MSNKRSNRYLPYFTDGYCVYQYITSECFNLLFLQWVRIQQEEWKSNYRSPQIHQVVLLWYRYVIEYNFEWMLISKNNFVLKSIIQYIIEWTQKLDFWYIHSSKYFYHEILWDFCDNNNKGVFLLVFWYLYNSFFSPYKYISTSI